MNAPKTGLRDAPALAGRTARPAKPRRRGRQALVVLGGLLIIVQVLSPATMILILAGMAPTVVAYLVDPQTTKRGAHAMAVLNFAGVLPVLAQLWAAGATRTAAMALLSDPMNWLLMYGAAGLAVSMMTMLPPFIAQILELGATQRVNEFEAQQRKLVDLWGRAVAGANPEPKAEDRGGDAAKQAKAT